jgi:hypothetical protein
VRPVAISRPSPVGQTVGDAFPSTQAAFAVVVVITGSSSRRRRAAATARSRGAVNQAYDQDGDGRRGGDQVDTSPTTSTSSTTALPPFVGWSDPARRDAVRRHGRGHLHVRAQTSAPSTARVGARTHSLPSCGASHQRGLGGSSADGQNAHVVRHGVDGAAGGVQRDRWVVFGAYDKAVPSSTPCRQRRILPDFPRRHHQGSVTVDPTGSALVPRARATASTASSHRRPRAVELWKSAGAVSPLWNNDWDGSGLIIDDYLFRVVEQPVPHRQAQPRLRARRQGHGRSEARVQRARVGRRAALRHR